MAMEVGVRVRFSSKMGEGIEGTVVKVTRYAWCPGETTMTVYSETTSCLHELHVVGGNYTVVGTGSVEEARKHYVEALSKYPAWRENFARGVTVGW